MQVIKQLASVIFSLALLAVIPGSGHSAEPLAEKRPGSGEREAKPRDAGKTNAGPAKAEWEKRRDEFNKLPPAEREAKRLEIKSRLEKRIAELRSHQTNNTLSAEDTKRLERNEQLLKRFEQNGPGLGAGARPAKHDAAAPRPPEK